MIPRNIPHKYHVTTVFASGPMDTNLSHLGRGNSTEDLPWSDRPVTVSMRHFLIACDGQAPTAMVSAIPRQAGLFMGLYKKASWTRSSVSVSVSSSRSSLEMLALRVGVRAKQWEVVFSSYITFGHGAYYRGVSALTLASISSNHSWRLGLFSRKPSHSTSAGTTP